MFHVSAQQVLQNSDSDEAKQYLEEVGPACADELTSVLISSSLIQLEAAGADSAADVEVPTSA